MQRLVKVDGKVRTDCTYPAGFMDVIEIDRTDEHFRLIYDTKGRFVTHRITKVDLSRSCIAQASEELRLSRQMQRARTLLLSLLCVSCLIAVLNHQKAQFGLHCIL